MTINSPELPDLNGEVNTVLMWLIGVLMFVVIPALASVIAYLFISHKKDLKTKSDEYKDDLDAIREKNLKMQTEMLSSFRLISDGLNPLGLSISKIDSTTNSTNGKVGTIEKIMMLKSDQNG